MERLHTQSGEHSKDGFVVNEDSPEEVVQGETYQRDSLFLKAHRKFWKLIPTERGCAFSPRPAVDDCSSQ